MKTDRATATEIPRSRNQPRGSRGAEAPVLPLAMPLFGARPDAMEIFRRLSICVIACGSVGGRIAIQLARMGVGCLILVDPKNFKPASLGTHDILPADIGESKAVVTGRRCKKINPAMRVTVHACRFEDIELFALADVDLFVMAPDQLAVEVAAAQRCVWLGKPLLQASVHGSTLTAQIRFFSNAEDGGCPVCAYGPAEWDLIARQTRFSCDGGAEGKAWSPAQGPATNSPAALCGTSSDLAIMQIIRAQIGLGKPVMNTLLEYCGFTHRTVITPLPRNPKCRIDHTTFGRMRVNHRLPALSLADLARQALGRLEPDTQFEVAGARWIEFAACACARPTPIRIFSSRSAADHGACPKCSGRLKPLEFYTHSITSVSLLGCAVFQPLNQLGLHRTNGILLRSSHRGCLIQSEGTASPE